MVNYKLYVRAFIFGIKLSLLVSCFALPVLVLFAFDLEGLLKQVPPLVNRGFEVEHVWISDKLDDIAGPAAKEGAVVYTFPTVEGKLLVLKSSKKNLSVSEKKRMLDVISSKLKKPKFRYLDEVEDLEPNTAMPWAQVESSKAYQALDTQQQARAKEQYFTEVVSVKPAFQALDEEQRAKARTQFFGQPPTVRSWLENIQTPEGSSKRFAITEDELAQPLKPFVPLGKFFFTIVVLAFYFPLTLALFRLLQVNVLFSKIANRLKKRN